MKKTHGNNGPRKIFFVAWDAQQKCWKADRQAPNQIVYLDGGMTQAEALKMAQSLTLRRVVPGGVK